MTNITRESKVNDDKKRPPGDEPFVMLDIPSTSSGHRFYPVREDFIARCEMVSQEPGKAP